jgi:transaldolase
MKIFLDSASIAEVKETASWGILSGVTTNPTLAAKEGQDFKTALKEICGLVEGPVSAEVLGTTRDEMVEEAHDLVKVADNVVIKIPVCPQGLAATKVLKDEGINVNMTLVFTVNQALLAASAGAAFASPFLGRLDDIGTDGLERLSDMVDAYRNYDIDTEIIAASIRHPMHVIKAALIGSDIATIPFKVIQQMVAHPLTEAGIDRFTADWEALQTKLNKPVSV